MSLKTKLITLLTAFTLIPLFLFGAYVFTRAQGLLESVRLDQLNNIADMKKDKIETFFRERAADIRSVESRLAVVQYLSSLNRPGLGSTDAAYEQAKADLDPRLYTFKESFGYLDVMLTDSHGTIVYVSNPEHAAIDIGKPLEIAGAFSEGKKGTYFTDVIFSEARGNRFVMWCLGPVRDAKGSFLGEVVTEIDMGPIYKFIEDSTGLGKTGEALIVKQIENGVLFLSPLRYKPEAALQMKVAFGERNALAAQKAGRGENGSGITHDYRGSEVLAAWRYIPSLRWGLVSKIDTADAFAHIYQLQKIVVYAGAIIVLIGAFAALLVSRTITSPLLHLQKGAEAVSSGDLKHRVATGSQDEIGRLSRAFDTMTEALASDIARREEMGKALQETAETSRAILNATTESVYLMDASLNILVLNETAAQRLGIRSDEAVGKNALDLIPRDVARSRKEHFDKVRTTKKIDTFEDTRENIVFEHVIYPIFDSAGNVIRFVVFSRDITERRKTEALRQSSAYHRSLLEASLDPLVAIDANGKITDVNAATEKVTGHSRQDLIGTDFSDYFTEPDKARAGYQQVFREGSVMDYSLEIRHCDGHTTPVLYNAAVYRDAAGSVIGVFAAARDITDRKKAEEEIRTLNRELEARVIERTAQLENSNRELEAFAYSVSHDLRSPLRSIEGFSLALLEDYSGKLDERGRDYLTRVRNATVRMGHLIDDLLKLSRVTRSEMNRERINLSSMVRTIAESLRKQHPDHPAEFIIADGLAAHGDERLLTVALENLISNAWKFSEKSSQIVIQFGILEKNGEPAFFVKDNGVGFDMHYAGKLFNPFQRLHRTDEFPGTGIGLATVKRIISRHGGQVWIESEEGKGTTVYFTLAE